VDGLLRAAAELEFDGVEHFGFGSRLAGPDFKLASALLNEHLKAGDDGQAAGLCQLEERSFKRRVDEVKDERGVELVFFQGQLLLDAGHAARGGVDDRVKFLF